MFKYAPDHSPESLKMIDFQTIRYGQPGLDLATIFSLNVKYDIFEKNFENYFHIYHSSLIDVIKSNSNMDLNKFSYNRHLKDYAEHSWIGFLTILYFLPVLEDPELIAYIKMAETSITPEILEQRSTNFGSPEILKHTGMYLKHCIDLNEKYVKGE